MPDGAAVECFAHGLASPVAAHTASVQVAGTTGRRKEPGDRPFDVG
jgi:hypothetical protein